MVIVARTDAEAANLIDTNSDPRDQPFIKGSTNASLSPLNELLHQWRSAGKSAGEIEKLTTDWMNQSNMCTYYEHIHNHLKKSNGDVAAWKKAEFLSHNAQRKLAKELGAGDVFWCWNAPRTREGYFHFAVRLCVLRCPGTRDMAERIDSPSPFLFL